MLHPGVTVGVLAATVLLLYALLHECPGVVQRPEPGGGGLSLLWQAYHKSLADTLATAEAGQVRLANTHKAKDSNGKTPVLHPGANTTLHWAAGP